MVARVWSERVGRKVVSCSLLEVFARDGAAGQKCVAVTCKIIQSSLASCESWQRQTSAGVSAGISGLLDAKYLQLTVQRRMLSLI